MYMATAVPANLLGIDDLKSHQRQSMDPNYDYKFINPVTPCIIGSYSPPCPNGGSDITYIMRYLVNKYNWLEWADEMVSVVNGVLRVQIRLNKLVEADNFEPACSDTRVFIEIDTSLNTNMGFSKGNLTAMQNSFCAINQQSLGTGTKHYNKTGHVFYLQQCHLRCEHGCRGWLFESSSGLRKWTVCDRE